MEKPVVTLAEARSYLVKRYRAEGGSRTWPDGIDAMDPAKGEQWYRGHEHEWLDDGTYVGAVNSPVVNKPLVNSLDPAVNDLVVNKPLRGDYEDQTAYMRDYMRWKRSQSALQK